MSEVSIQPIEAMSDNASAVVDLTAQDLRRAGMDRYEAEAFADPTSLEHRERQLEKLAQHPDRYLGAFATGQLVGFSKSNEWLAGDQIPFASKLGRSALRLMTKVVYNHLDGRPFGIHGLVVNQELDSPDEVIQDLLSRAIAAADRHEVRIAQYFMDPIQPLLRQNGFVPTGKFGRPIGELNQQLFSRPGSF